MKQKQLEKLLEKAEEIVRQAGALFFEKDLLGDVSRKGKTDFVTRVDLEVEAFFKVHLAKLLPEAQFLGEEQAEREIDFQGMVWIADPVDGTTNLIHGFRRSAVSLALACAEHVVLGIVYNPYTKELFSAGKGMGAFCNGEAIAVSRETRFSECLIAVGTNPGCRQMWKQNFWMMQAIYNRCHDIRRTGSAALDLCDVACARTDGYFEEGLKPWDYAAGMLIVSEAEGVVSAPGGGMPSLRTGGGIIAANPVISEELQLLWQNRKADLLQGE